MFKLIIKLVLLLSLIVILVVVGISSGVINISKINNSNNSGQEIVAKIKEIGNLELIKFNVNYTVEDTVGNDTLFSNKLMANNKILAVIAGEVDACINLTGISEGDVKIHKDTVYLTLQEPVLCNTKVNFERSKFYDTNLNSYLFNQNMIEKYFPNIENNLKAEAIRVGFLDQAKENADKILSTIFKEMFKKKFILEFKEN